MKKKRVYRCNQPGHTVNTDIHCPAATSRHSHSRYRSPFGTALIAILTLLLQSCAGSGETLARKPADAPADVNLTGRWKMRENFADMERRIARAIRETDGIDDEKLLRSVSSGAGQNRRRSRDVGGLVYVFLENGSQLKITQTGHGLFIGFDRSVVEEYRFGEARLVRTGGAVAQRVSGWEGESYVVETLDEEGMKLTERYSLDAAARTLTREIVLRGEDSRQVTIVQSFDSELP